MIMLGFFISLIIFVIIFICFWPPFGKKADRQKRKEYAGRSQSFRDGKFHNDTDFKMMVRNAPKDKRTVSDNNKIPDRILPSSPRYFVKENDGSFRVTWFGHSTTLIYVSGKTILIDPVFSDRTSPVTFAGNKRFSQLKTGVGDLPDIDVVLITHDHYDHLDYRTIRSLADKTRHFIVPLGVENHLSRWNIADSKITYMSVWEHIEIEGLKITCTPAKHFSGRCLFDWNRTMWASWFIDAGDIRIFESGDTGFGEHFKQINDRLGNVDLAIMECGQYDVTWPNVHMFPEQSVQATLILGARAVLPIHWGAFCLCNHGWDDSVRRFVREAEKHNINVYTPRLEQTVEIDVNKRYEDRWYEKL